MLSDQIWLQLCLIIKTMMREYKKCLICVLKMNKSLMGFGTRVNDDIILISRSNIPRFQWINCVCHNDALLKMKFTRFCNSVSDKNTPVFSSFSSVLWSYSGYTLPDGLISVQYPCPSFLVYLLVLRLFWDRIAGLKSLYCSVHYQGLVVGLFKLLCHE